MWRQSKIANSKCPISFCAMSSPFFEVGESDDSDFLRLRTRFMVRE